MLQKKWILPSVAAVALLLVGGFFLFSKDDDEKIILRNFDRIVELAQKDGNESPFVTIGQSRDMLRYFAAEPSVEVGPPVPSISDRRELEGVIIQLRQTLQVFSVRIIRRNLTLAGDALTAQMEVEAEANATYAGESGRDRRRFTIDWVKEEGDWLIQRVRLEGEPLQTGGESFRF